MAKDGLVFIDANHDWISLCWRLLDWLITTLSGSFRLFTMRVEIGDKPVFKGRKHALGDFGIGGSHHRCSQSGHCC